MTSEPARARLLWAILSLVLPITFGLVTAYRNLALAFSEAIHFAMKRSVPYSAVLRHSAVVHWSSLIPKASRSSSRRPINSFFCLSTQHAHPHQCFFNTRHFGSLVPFIRTTNLANRIHLLHMITSIALISCFHERVVIGDRMVSANVISPTDAVNQEAVVGSAQRVVVSRAWAPHDATLQHCLEYLGS